MDDSCDSCMYMRPRGPARSRGYVCVYGGRKQFWGPEKVTPHVHDCTRPDWCPVFGLRHCESCDLVGKVSNPGAVCEDCKTRGRRKEWDAVQEMSCGMGIRLSFGYGLITQNVESV